MPAGHLVFRCQHEPIETIGRQGQQEIQLADRREGITAEHLYRHHAGKGRQIQLRRLGAARHIGYAQDDLGVAVFAGVFTGVSQDAPVSRREHLQAATAKRLGLLAHCEHAPGPVEQ